MLQEQKILYTIDKADKLREWLVSIGVDITIPNYVNSTSYRGLTPLMEAIVIFGESYAHDEWASGILKQLLHLGVDPKFVAALPSQVGEEGELVNAIAFAASRGAIQAFAIIYNHDPNSIYAEIEPGMNAFMFLLSPLDEPIFTTDDCEKYKCLIRFLVQEKGCNVNELLLDDLTCRPNAMGFLTELGVVLSDADDL